MTCIGTPVSWLRLETFALDNRDAAIADHVAACPACARCLDDIRAPGPGIELPRLVVPATPVRKRWLWWLAPAMAAAAAAIVLLVVIRRPEQLHGENVTIVKGVGEVVVGIVRERAGTIRDDVTTYAPGDRFKVVVTCPPDATAWIDVAVDDAGQLDYPLAPVQVSCGNRVALPGAFTITGDRPNKICIRIAADAPPPRGASADTACVTVTRD